MTRHALLITISILLLPTAFGAEEKDTRRAEEMVKHAVQDLIPAKEYEQAIKFLDAALIYDPDNWQAYASKGYCYYSLGDYRRALANYEHAKMLNPDNPKLDNFIARAGEKLKESPAKDSGRPERDRARRALEQEGAGEEAPLDYRTLDDRPEIIPAPDAKAPARRRPARSRSANVKTDQSRNWSVEGALVYLGQDSLSGARDKMPLFARNIGYSQVSASCGDWAKSLQLCGGMRAGQDFRIFSEFEYIWGREFELFGAAGPYNLYYGIESRAYIIGAGFEYLLHLEQVDLGFELMFGLLDCMLDFQALDELYAYAVSGTLRGDRITVSLNQRVERYFHRNFSAFGALGYRFARVKQLTGQLNTGEPIALAEINDPYNGSYIDIASEFIINSYPELEYATVDFGGLTLSLGLEVHY